MDVWPLVAIHTPFSIAECEGCPLLREKEVEIEGNSVTYPTAPVAR